MSQGVWSYSIAANGYPRGVFLLVGAGEAAEWRKVAPLPYITEVIIRRDGSGKITGREYRLTMDPDGADTVLAHDDDLDNGAWMPKLDLPKVRDTKIRAAAGTAIGMIGDDSPRVESVPAWTGHGLQIPPGDVGPLGYAETAGSEEDAREVWAEVGEILGRPGNGPGAFFFGTALAAPFIAPFRRQSFICHACGGSSGGKSTMMRLSGAAFGRVDDVVGSWNLARVANSEDLLRLGVLPSFRDEIGMLGRLTGREAESMIFQLTEGAQRTRARQKGGGTDRTAKFRSALMSTGNDSLLGMATEQEGLNARVVEVDNRMVADKATAERLAALSTLAYGWPLKWLRDHVTLDDAWRAIATAERDLGLAGAAGADVRIGQNVALGVAGAALFEQITSVSGLRDAALTAGREVYGQMVAEMRETAMKQGDKLLAVIAEAYAAKPSLFPPKHAYSGVTATDLVTEAFGVTYTEGTEERIAVFSNKLKVICEGAGIVSPRTGLRDLRADGRLVLEDSPSRQGLTKREWLGQSIGDVWCYVIRRAEPRAPEDAVTGPTPAVADVPLPPMPTLPFTVAEQPDKVPAPAATKAQERPEVPAQPDRARATRPVRNGGPTRHWAVEPGTLFDPSTGASVVLDGSAGTELPALVALACQHSPGDVTLVIGPAMRETYGLPSARLEMKTGAWTKAGKPTRSGHGAAFLPLVEAGWHQPHKPSELPVIMATTTIQHASHGPRMVRLTVAEWLRDAEFPRGPVGDAAGATELAFRLSRYTELTGWSFSSSAANTAVQALRDSIASTARKSVRWVPEYLYKWPQWSAADAWKRQPTAAEITMGFVHGYDAVKNYLPAYGQAIVTGDELQHDISGEFDAGRAGYWLITVPEWPHPGVPAPVHEHPAGSRVWVTTAIAKLYHEAGIEPSIQESWTAQAIAYEGMRAFQRKVWDALKTLETSGATNAKGRPLDPEEGAVWDALKATYRTLHGKLRQPGQKIAARPDWGAAVRDAAWTGVLRKVYKAAGVLPMAKDGRITDTPRLPLAVDLDEVVYAASTDDPTVQPPAGLRLVTPGSLAGLGQFRPKTSQTMTEWTEGGSRV